MKNMRKIVALFLALMLLTMALPALAGDYAPGVEDEATMKGGVVWVTAAGAEYYLTREGYDVAFACISGEKMIIAINNGCYIIEIPSRDGMVRLETIQAIACDFADEL